MALVQSRFSWFQYILAPTLIVLKKDKLKGGGDNDSKTTNNDFSKYMLFMTVVPQHNILRRINDLGLFLYFRGVKG
jgi:hypothetical protein